MNLIRLTPSKGETAIRDRSILSIRVERFFFFLLRVLRASVVMILINHGDTEHMEDTSERRTS